MTPAERERRSDLVTHRPMIGLVRERDKVLRRVAVEVDPNAPDLRVLAERMTSTARAVNGLGLAAPQVGHSLRLVVVAGRALPTGTKPWEPDWKAIANPAIVLGGTLETAAEGCLTMPHRWWRVPRRTTVAVEGIDLRTDEVVRAKVTDPLLARLWQHELDHLDGRLISEGGYEEVHRG